MRLFRSKKGDFNVLLAIIITLVVGLLILIIGYQMHSKSKDIDDDEKCQMSIFANHQIGRARRKSLGALDFPVAFDCPRKFLKITYEDVEKYRRIDDNLLKTMIAEEMKSCWAKVGAGKLDPFRASSNVNEHFCMVCSDIVFDPTIIEAAREQRYDLKGFQYWIAAHKLPGLKTSLYEFVTSKRPSEDDLRDLIAQQHTPESKFNMDDKYVVVWRVEKWEPGRWEQAFSVIGGVLTLGAVTYGAAVGLGIISISDGAQISQQVIVIPEERLSETRDVTAGDVARTIYSVTPLGWASEAPVYDYCTKMIN
ncbi:hypothetical protein JW898_01175 [Candidatus Woesearchaeota archaeon]|nr:hypothetical protein [Candidatus Woesearchaeota archaeon]